jgi:hypothetical protein
MSPLQMRIVTISLSLLLSFALPRSPFEHFHRSASSALNGTGEYVLDLGLRFKILIYIPRSLVGQSYFIFFRCNLPYVTAGIILTPFLLTVVESAFV